MASRTGAKPGIGGSWAVKGKGSVCIMKCFREVKWDEEQKQVTGAEVKRSQVMLLKGPFMCIVGGEWRG